MPQTSCRQLRDFIAEFSRIKKAVNTPKINRAIDAPGLERFFADFAQNMKSFRQPGTNLNIFDICGLGRNEVRNCSVLAWLLDENGSHGLGCRFLKGILARCGVKSIPDAALAGGYATRTEFCPNGDNADRVDIVCDGKDFLLYIEVKIDSFEHAVQTERYFAKMKNNSGGRAYALLFISPDTPPASQDAQLVRWKDCAAVMDSLAADEMTQDEFNLAGILRQYANFVRRF